MYGTFCTNPWTNSVQIRLNAGLSISCDHFAKHQYVMSVANSPLQIYATLKKHIACRASPTDLTKYPWVINCFPGSISQDCSPADSIHCVQCCSISHTVGQAICSYCTTIMITKGRICLFLHQNLWQDN